VIEKRQEGTGLAIGIVGEMTRCVSKVGRDIVEVLSGFQELLTSMSDPIIV
jgi:hypothetical protein